MKSEFQIRERAARAMSVQPSGDLRRIGNLVAIGTATLAAFVMLRFVPDGFLTADTLVFLAVAAGFALTVCGTLAISRVEWTDSRRTFFSLSLVIWMFVMISEAIFVHLGNTESAAAGDFAAGVYQQVAAWGLAFMALLFITIKHPSYLTTAFSGQFKWISLFALVALLSVAVSASPMYSLAWGVKLVLIVMLLAGLASCLKDQDDLARFFQALLLGTLGVAVARFLTPFILPGPAFRGGRMEMIAGSSGTAGLLLMLAIVNLKFKKSPWYLLIAGFSVVMMMLAGGKAGMLGSFLSVIVFFVALRKVGKGLVTVLVLGLVFLIFVSVTPLGQYVGNYIQSGESSTLTGRTNLWAVVWPEILERPFLGHGYMTSRFLSVDVEGAFPEAGQTHNSFLEPMYNIGFVGFLLILIMNIVIVRNLMGVMKSRPGPAYQYMAAGALAMYVNSFAWGIFTATPFGGSPNSAFMTFLAILIISVALKRQTQNTLALE